MKTNRKFMHDIKGIRSSDDGRDRPHEANTGLGTISYSSMDIEIFKIRNPVDFELLKEFYGIS